MKLSLVAQSFFGPPGGGQLFTLGWLQGGAQLKGTAGIKMATTGRREKGGDNSLP